MKNYQYVNHPDNPHTKIVRPMWGRKVEEGYTVEDIAEMYRCDVELVRLVLDGGSANDMARA